MRKSAIAAVFLAVMTVNISVFADFTDPAWYTGDTRDKAEVNAGGYSTVIITKDSDGSIVYLNQADSIYSGSMNFLLKTNPEIGRYTVKLGSSTSSPMETYFYVGADSDNPGDSGDLYMKRLQNERDNGDGTYDIGYYAMVNSTQYGNYTYLKVGCKNGDANKYGSIQLKAGDYTQYSGSGDIYLIFQLNDVPAAYRDSAAVYLGPSSPGGGE